MYSPKIKVGRVPPALPCPTESFAPVGDHEFGTEMGQAEAKLTEYVCA
jgi:hypothetical protein